MFTVNNRVRNVRTLSPQHPSYKGAYAQLACCLSCCTLGLAADLDPTQPCPACKGTLLTDNIYGQWSNMDGDKPLRDGRWLLTDQALYTIASFL